MKKISILLILLLVSANLQAEDNLKFYVEKALKNNFQLNAERKNFETAKQNKNISRSEFLPTITLSGDQSSTTSTNKTNKNGITLPDSSLDSESKTFTVIAYGYRRAVACPARLPGWLNKWSCQVAIKRQVARLQPQSCCQVVNQ